MIIATISQQRSGTKLLGSYLSQLPEAVSLGEAFFPDNIRPCTFRGFRKMIGGEEAMQLGSEACLDRFMEYLHILAPILQFDVMYNQIEYACVSWNSFQMPFLYGFLMSRKCIILSLDRDPLDSFVSGKYVESAGVAHFLPDEAAGLPPDRIALDVNEYVAHRNYVLGMRRQLADLCQDYDFFLPIAYEDLTDRSKLMGMLASVMNRNAEYHMQNVRVSEHYPIREKIRPTPVDYSQVFSNIGELRQMG